MGGREGGVLLRGGFLVDTPGALSQARTDKQRVLENKHSRVTANGNGLKSKQKSGLCVSLT